MSNLFTMFFSFKGRLNRLEFLKRSLILLVGDGFIHGIAALFFSVVMGPSGPAVSELVVKIVDFGVWCSHITLLTRRLHDLNRSGWWQLIFQIPFIISLVGVLVLAVGFVMQNFGLGIAGAVVIGVAGLISAIFSIWTYCFKGTTGPNDYGSDPLNSTATVVASQVPEAPKAIEEKVEEVKVEVKEAEKVVPAEVVETAEAKAETIKDETIETVEAKAEDVTDGGKDTAPKA